MAIFPGRQVEMGGRVNKCEVKSLKLKGKWNKEKDSLKSM